MKRFTKQFKRVRENTQKSPKECIGRNQENEKQNNYVYAGDYEKSNVP